MDEIGTELRRIGVIHITILSYYCI